MKDLIGINAIKSIWDILPISGSGTLMVLCQANVPLTGTDFDLFIKGGSVLGFVVISIKYLVRRNTNLTSDLKELNQMVNNMNQSRIEALERKLERYEETILHERAENEKLRVKISVLEGK